MNESNASDCFSFTFNTINRGVNVFPSKLNKMKGVLKFCDLLFSHADQKGAMTEHTVGVVRARLVPGVGPYTVFDLVRRPKSWGKMCKVCTAQEQRPVYHKLEKSACEPTKRAKERALESKRLQHNLVDPSADRISGPQVARKSKRKAPAEKTPEERMTIPQIKKKRLDMKVPGCEFAGLKRKAELVAFLTEKLLAQKQPQPSNPV